MSTDLTRPGLDCPGTRPDLARQLLTAWTAWRLASATCRSPATR